MKFKQITAILTIVCLCVSGIFSKAQARVPRTLDGKGSQFIYSDEQTWNPTPQSFLSATITDKWRLDDTEVTLMDDIFYYKKMNLCFPAEANKISFAGTPRVPAPADITVETCLLPEFKQYPPGLLPGHHIIPFADLSRQ